MTSKTLGVLLAVLAALQFLGAASDLTDLTSPEGAAWLQLTIGAAQAFVAVYTAKVALTPADPAHPDNLSSNQLMRLADKAAASGNGH
jgi:hypothetical protein